MSLAKEQDILVKKLLSMQQAPWPDNQDASRWDIYQEMVQRRLLSLLRSAYPRTTKTIGKSDFDSVAREWLSKGQPTERYFWRIPIAFEKDTVIRHRLSDPQGELFEYESIRWQVAHSPFPKLRPTELDFDQPLVLNPSLVLRDFGFHVHVENGPQKPVSLAIFRCSENLVRVWTLAPLMKALLQHQQTSPSQTLKEVTMASAKLLKREIDGVFLEQLTEVIRKASQAEITYTVLPD